MPNMRYVITLTPEVMGQFSVLFPDIPEAITYGNSREHALDMGLHALITSLEFYFQDGRLVPVSSFVTPSLDDAELPTDISDRVRAHSPALS